MEKTDLDSVTASALMTKVRDQIGDRYPPQRDNAPHLVPALIAVLTRQPLARTDKIPNSQLTVEDLITYGLFRWVTDKAGQKGFLECPFVIVWLLASWSGHKALAHFRLDSYNEIQHAFAPDLPLGLQCWQHWEETTAYFRMLKSSLLDGLTVPLSELHSGAYLSAEAANLKIKVQNLEQKLVASHQYETGNFPKLPK